MIAGYWLSFIAFCNATSVVRGILRLLVMAQTIGIGETCLLTATTWEIAKHVYHLCKGGRWDSSVVDREDSL